jgi:hypothetical protein
MIVVYSKSRHGTRTAHAALQNIFRQKEIKHAKRIEEEKLEKIDDFLPNSPIF